MTKIISLDSFIKEPVLVLEVEGVKHAMVPTTVETFLENMKDIEALSINATPVQELEITVRIILRAFPTLTEKQVKSWSLEQIQGIAEVARSVSGEVVSTEEDKEPKKAKRSKAKSAS